MPNTTNYNWVTPADTDLVKDGAAAIRTLGTSIDTTTKNLNPSTTLGDIEYRSSTSNVNTRLPLGTANQQLRVNSGATAPEWFTSTPSGGMTLISTTTFSGTSVTLSSIAGTYKHLLAVFSGITANSNYYLNVKPNNATNCTSQNWDMGNSTGTVSPYSASEFYFNSNSAVNSSNAANAGNVWIYNYASTTATKSITGFFEYSSSSTIRAAMGIGIVDTTSAITSLVFGAGGNTFSAGTLLLYGVS